MNFYANKCLSLLPFFFLFHLLLHFCLAQTWSQVDQQNCVEQCMTTGVNCSSGCGIPSDCAVGWRGQISRRCYKIVYPTTPGYTWAQAQTNCQVNNTGVLVSVHSQMENSFLVGLIVNTLNPDSKNHNFWIGKQLTRATGGSVTGSSWADASPVDYGNPMGGAGTYPWGPGEPVTAGNCVRMMGYGPYRGLWYDANCNQATNLVPTSGYFCKGCPDGWSLFNGHCYKAFVSASQSGQFVHFQRLCSIYNSTMVSIHSAAENNFVFGLVQAEDPTIGGFMIGMQLSRDANCYVTGASWLDGSPVDFGANLGGGVYPWADSNTGWYPQPDNPSPYCESIVRVSVTASNEPGRWDDLQVNVPLQGTVCKF